MDSQSTTSIPFAGVPPELARRIESRLESL